MKNSTWVLAKETHAAPGAMIVPPAFACEHIVFTPVLRGGGISCDNYVPPPSRIEHICKIISGSSLSLLSNLTQKRPCGRWDLLVEHS
jgi:hypothetical protein